MHKGLKPFQEFSFWGEEEDQVKSTEMCLNNLVTGKCERIVNLFLSALSFIWLVYSIHLSE